MFYGEQVKDYLKLTTASERGDAIEVRRFLSSGMLIDEDSRSIFINNALVRASGRGHIEIARLLLDSGADPNEADALYWASKEGQTDVEKLLLDSGAVPNVEHAIANQRYDDLSDRLQDPLTG